MQLGFIGLGNMGLPMARNLLRAGHELRVYNRTRSRADALASDGATVVTGAAETARGTEAVLTMLADDRAAEDVVFGSEGLLNALPHGGVHISMSTISVALSKRLAESHAQRGQIYISAPVFGRPEAAAAQKLWVVAAGDESQVGRFKPVFDAIGRGTSITGPEPWKANTIKLCGNFLIMSMMEALGEVFALARKSGIDPHQALEIANSALFNSPIYANYGKTIADEAFEPAGFRLQLGLKDAGLVLEASKESAVPMPLAALVRDHMLSAMAHGRGDADWSVFATIPAEMANASKTAHGR